mmetsp:Transcript_31862/g.56209  ORF Transcript_31862/g.56209 Transcript_31862/m.56209 type:complete len:95 (-) Transcript_31862:10-294(-)
MGSVMLQDPLRGHSDVARLTPAMFMPLRSVTIGYTGTAATAAPQYRKVQGAAPLHGHCQQQWVTLSLLQRMVLLCTESFWDNVNDDQVGFSCGS